MKITGVKIHHVEWERGPYHWRDEIMPSGPTARTALLRVLTDEGVEGLAPYSAGANVEEIKWQLLGEDPLDRERIWHKFWRNLRTSRLGFAIGPVDCALWDLLGKVSNMPVYKLLGGMRDRVPAYASTVTLDSLQEYMDLAEVCLQKGYKAIKLHAWGRLEQDAELCRALRKKVGDDIELMYDASSMFNIFEDAMWFGRQLEEQGFLWYEEPMDHFNMTVLALRGCRHLNGVSKNHAEVARGMWQGLWPEKPEDVPIDHVTNGVHVPTWVEPKMELLFNKYLGPDWLEDHDNPLIWELVEEIPNEELWRTHYWLKIKLIDAIRDRSRQRWTGDRVSFLLYTVALFLGIIPEC